MKINAVVSKNTTVTADKAGSVVATKDTGLNNVAAVGPMNTGVAADKAGLSVEAANTALTGGLTSVVGGNCVAVGPMNTAVAVVNAGSVLTPFLLSFFCDCQHYP